MNNNLKVIRSLKNISQQQLTGLNNVRYFEEALSSLINMVKERNEELSLLLIYINHVNR
jgi:PleD family two-component response regulator